MKIPTLEEAQYFMAEAQDLNPGPWVQHSINAAEAAKAIAEHHPNLDSEIAYIFGYLHDIGRREGVTQMRHIIDGYDFLQKKGFDDAARISMTHSFSIGNVNSFAGGWDCSEEELQFVKDYLEKTEFTEYDKLIQLCDALAMPSGVCLIEKRLIDVVLRYGVSEYTVPRWKAYLKIQKALKKLLAGQFTVYCRMWLKIHLVLIHAEN